MTTSNTWRCSRGWIDAIPGTRRFGPSASRFVTLACLLGLLAQPAAAQSEGNDDGAHVVITGRVDVGAQEQTDSVVIFHGPAVIDGHVNGSVVAFNGDVVVRGNVDDNVVALKGRATIEDGATVGGDVVSSRRPAVASGAHVDGDIRRVNFRNFFRAFGWLLWLGWWLAVGVSMFVLGVLLLALLTTSFRRSSKQVERASVRRSAGDLLWPSAFRSSPRSCSSR